ncbi:MAG: glutathione S-transferase [Pseudomonadales bacterium]|nr:glutathione S-transferase [Pseudomonadales bacterium]
MTGNTPILFKGSPGSPYTRKMLALLRYRQLPYRLLIGGHDQDFGLPKPKVALLPTFYLPDARGEIEAVVDSTPLIRRIEQDHPNARGALPDDPLIAFFDTLLEDYGDEWLTKAMFHYRWHYAADIENAGRILPRWSLLSAPEEEIDKRKAYFTRRQIDRLYVVGSNEITTPVIESSYRRFLEIMDAHLQRFPFLLGRRPGSADFAVYGQLTQLALFDPTPRALTLDVAPRVYAWVDVVDDLSGLEVDDSGWLARDQLADALRPLLRELGRTYVPVMLANARALNAGEKEVHCEVEGQVWQQQAFPYQGRCVAELRTAYARLDEYDRKAADAVLDGTGCSELFR